MEWKTRITELLGCKYPIIEGAYGGFGTWEFAASVADTGAFGLITANVYKTPEKLREAINNCRDATNGVFGVNVSGGPTPRNHEMLKVILEEGLPLETAGYKPDEFAPRIKEAGITWIHKSARVKDAVHAEKLGADALIVVGLEGVGFKNPEQLPTLITTMMAKRMLNVPFIASGGIGDATGFMGAIGMGADAIMMGTAFMATDECPIGKKAKDRIIQSTPFDLRLRNRVLSPPDPVEYKKAMKLKDKLPFDKWIRQLELVQLKKPAWEVDVDSDDGVTNQEDLRRVEPSRIVSLAVGVLDQIVPVKDFIDTMLQGAEEIIDDIEFIKMHDSPDN